MGWLYQLFWSKKVIIDFHNINIVKRDDYSYQKGFAHCASGICCGMSSLGAGLAIGLAGDAGVRALGQQDRIFVGMMLILIFAEALGLYGMIISLILAQ